MDFFFFFFFFKNFEIVFQTKFQSSKCKNALKNKKIFALIIKSILFICLMGKYVYYLPLLFDFWSIFLLN